jgi:hypothetical protein
MLPSRENSVWLPRLVTIWSRIHFTRGAGMGKTSKEPSDACRGSTRMSSSAPHERPSANWAKTVWRAAHASLFPHERARIVQAPEPGETPHRVEDACLVQDLHSSLRTAHREDDAAA